MAGFRSPLSRREIVPHVHKERFAFTAPLGLNSPLTCIHVRLLGPCFKTGRSLQQSTRQGTPDCNRQGLLAIQVRVGCLSGLEPGDRELMHKARTSSRATGLVPTVPAVNPVRDAPVDSHWYQRSESLLIPTTADSDQVPRIGSDRTTSRKASFTATQFHVLLTLSSKFFSNFHHCTCLLSVLGSYLALRGVYLALWAALSSNPTLGRDQQSQISPPYGPITLCGLWPLSSWTLTGVCALEEILPNATFRMTCMASSSALGYSHFTRRY